MKKRLLFYFSLITFMIFSFTRCSQDFLETSDELENFAREAKLYFEQNASGIQKISIGNPKTALSRSLNLSSAIIIPRWEKQECFKNEYFSILEIPLDGNVYIKSNYTTKTLNTNAIFSSSDVSMKLIIRKENRTEELEYFVATIINQKQQSSLFSNPEQASSSGYFQPPSNGLIIISSIEGEYIGAFMYNNGIRNCVRLARTSGEKGKIASENIIGSFNLMDSDNSSLFSRPGESGGDVTVYCALCNKANCDGNCEVLVIPCSICHKPLEQCTGHFEPPIKVCPKCGKTGCSGNCSLTGGNGEISSTLVSPQGDLSKQMFSNDSKLTKEQWKKVEKALKAINEDCMGGKLFGRASKIKPKIIHNDTISAHGRYSYSTNTIHIKDFEEKNLHENVEGTLLHELLHTVHPQNTPGRLNREIEVHFAVYRYSISNGNRIPLSGEKYKNMSMLHATMDKNYNIIDQDMYDMFYEDIINDLKNNGYEKYPESISERNFNTVKELSKDC